MSRGLPLDDRDRAPWLVDLSHELTRQPAPVLACSALKRRYRDVLRSRAPMVFFAHLAGSGQTITKRLLARQHEFMSPDLLGSQLASLEPLGADEWGFTCDLGRKPEDLVDAILDAASSTVCPTDLMPGR
ncbi:hypothetical protein GCM10022240_26230 [Microbacterium kribbense]|uniref:gluconokinase n=2 Tax=Microbacterium kribbense TaxID=433645 RepID=A0ABP7GR18_9MICO